MRTRSTQQMDNNLYSYVNNTENPKVALVIYISVYTTVAAYWMTTTKHNVDTSKYTGR